MSRKLATNVTVEGDTYKAGTVPPAEVAEKINHPRAWADEGKKAKAEPAGGDDKGKKAKAEPAGGDDKGYAGQSPDELKAEVDKRNDDREDDNQIEVEGTGKDGNVLKGDLVAALEADDADNA